jgi:hypothetical protein
MLIDAQLPKPGVGLIPDPILAMKKKQEKGKKGKKVTTSFI